MQPMILKIATKEVAVSMIHICKTSHLFRMGVKLAAVEFHIAIMRKSWQV